MKIFIEEITVKDAKHAKQNTLQYPLFLYYVLEKYRKHKRGGVILGINHTSSQT